MADCQAQTSYLNHLIVTSSASYLLWLDFLKCVIWYALLQSSPNFLFKSFNHELNHVWYPMTGVLFNVSSDTLYCSQAQTCYLNHLIMNTVMSDILWLEFLNVGYRTCMNSWQNQLIIRLGLHCCRGFQMTHFKKLKALDIKHAWIHGRMGWILGWCLTAVEEGIRWQV